MGSSSKSPLPGSLLRLVSDDGPDTLTDLVDSSLGVLLSLPTRVFPEGAFILDTEALNGHYVILTGKALEFAVSDRGEPDADPIELGSKDVIGLELNIRVQAVTDITVAVIDSASLRNASATLRDKARDYVIEATRKRSSDNRRRLIERDTRIEEHEGVVNALDSQLQAQELEFEAKSGALRADIEDRIIDNTRLARHTVRLNTEIENKNKELQSAATILTLYKEEIEEIEETLSKRSTELRDLRNELAALSGLAPVLERMSSSENSEWVKLAQKALTLLYTQGRKT